MLSAFTVTAWEVGGSAHCPVSGLSRRTVACHRAYWPPVSRCFVSFLFCCLIFVSPQVHRSDSPGGKDCSGTFGATPLEGTGDKETWSLCPRGAEGPGPVPSPGLRAPIGPAAPSAGSAAEAGRAGFRLGLLHPGSRKRASGEGSPEGTSHSQWRPPPARETPGLTAVFPHHHHQL